VKKRHLSGSGWGTLDQTLPSPFDLRPGSAPLPGSFISFEGIEGSGKSTQILILADRLRQAGKEVVLTREPGGTELGKGLRTLLLQATESPPAPLAELLLYAADRAQHLEELVEPALARGAVVLTDRFLDATLAYQGYGRELGCALILNIHSHPPLDRRPVRTVLLDMDAETGLGRARERNRHEGTAASEGRFEEEELAFHTRVRDGYLLLAAQDPERFRVIDADREIDEVAEMVWDTVRDVVLDFS
jgi:dTMP kinase